MKWGSDVNALLEALDCNTHLTSRLSSIERLVTYQQKQASFSVPFNTEMAAERSRLMRMSQQ